MIELNPPEFAKITPLVQAIDHSVAIVYAVIEGNSPGRVFVDDPLTPTSALLFPDGTFFYVVGDEKNEAFCQDLVGLLFDDIIPHAEEKELVLFSFSNAWINKLDALLQVKGAIRIVRKFFSFNSEKFSAHRDWRLRIPGVFSITPIGEQLAERHPAYKPVVDPSSKRFGFCLMRGDEIVSECSSIYVGRGEAEIDVHTDEKYQGQGYATLTASAFIEACLSRGLTPNWACWPERQASWALAKRLGFEEKTDLPVHLWAEGL